MKKLYLLRHAKSSWKHPELKDHDRPFNKRGESDAPLMAKLLKQQNIFPDIILSSTAVRAIEYSKILAEKLDYKKKDIDASKGLYLVGEDEMFKIMKSINDKYKTAFIVGHNPGITEFANSLCNHDIDNIPTSGVFGIEFNVNSWNEVEYGKGKFVMFEFPRKYY